MSKKNTKTNKNPKNVKARQPKDDVLNKKEVLEKETKEKVKKETKKEVKEEKKEEIKKEERKEEVKAISKKEAKAKAEVKSKKKKFFKSLFLSLIILVVSGVLLYPMLTSTRFGLDLSGGFEILYEVQDEDGKEVSDEAVKNTYKTILKRIDILGVSEPEITIEGKNIRIALAGVNDMTEAKKTLSSMAKLTFRNSKDEKLMDADVLKANGVHVAVDKDNVGTYYLSIDIAKPDEFYEQTEKIRQTGDVLVTWLDFDEDEDSFEKEKENCGSLNNSRCISYASIAGPLTGSSVQLTGNFTYDEANSLAELINSGSLPTKLVELSSKTVDASFGEDALKDTFIAGIVAVLLIMLFMIWMYHFSGFIASIGIVTYTMLIFAIFNMVGGRLTLPSIAAVVIGIGMAVDATVLSFERIKDELRAKANLEHAYEAGNKGSLVSIIDANITTLIAAVILFIFGESSVKGFATMLIISIIVTLFVMVYLVRALLKGFVYSNRFEGKFNRFIGLKNVDKKPLVTKFNYVHHRFKFIALTLFILVAGGIYLGTKGLNLSVDFKGGSSITLNTKEKINASDVKKEVEQLGYKVNNADKISEGVYMTLSDTLDAEDTAKIETYFNENEKYKGATTSIGSVSNTVKKELVKNALMSLLYAAIGIIIYVSLRFTFRYGISAILTLLQDVLVTIILFSVFGFEVSPMFIAAILSIIGYSINDTIVIFDHIRENKKKLYKDRVKTYDELKELVNTSVKATVVRSLVTSITTIIPVILLIALGSHEILTFNYALLIGLTAGTYSSIFIASQIWLMLEKHNVGKPEKKKWYEVEVKDEVEELKVKGINC